MFVGPVEILNVLDTYEFDDYFLYASSMFDVAAKQKRRDEVFPEECRKAFELGKGIVEKLK